MQLDRITKPSVVLSTNGPVISFSLVRRMRLELTRANAHYPLNRPTRNSYQIICTHYTSFHPISFACYVHNDTK